MTVEGGRPQIKQNNHKKNDNDDLSHRRVDGAATSQASREAQRRRAPNKLQSEADIKRAKRELASRGRAAAAAAIRPPAEVDHCCLEPTDRRRGPGTCSFIGIQMTTIARATESARDQRSWEGPIEWRLRRGLVEHKRETGGPNERA